jgi:hypothetical protein
MAAAMAVVALAGLAHAQRKVIPWVELNYPDVEQYRRPALLGVAIGAVTFDEFVVTTIPKESPRVFELFQRTVPGVKIIPSLKTAAYTPRYRRFDDPGLWAAFARDVRVACEATGSKRFVIDSETALTPVWEGEYKIDHDRLAKALGQLPQEIEYIWYPTVLGSPEYTPMRNEGSLEVCRTAARGLRHVVFADHSYGVRTTDPSTTIPKVRLRNSTKLRDVGTVIPLLYFCDRSDKVHTDWQAEQLPELIEGDLLPAGEFLLYPGIKNFAQMMSQAGVVLRRHHEETLRESREELQRVRSKLKATEEELERVRGSADPVGSARPPHPYDTRPASSTPRCGGV